MERKLRLYKLKDVLEILDNDDSDFGDGDESDTESECDPKDIVAPFDYFFFHCCSHCVCHCIFTLIFISNIN